MIATPQHLKLNLKLMLPDENTGQLSFVEAPDFENPGDANNDNNYQVQVTLTINEFDRDGIGGAGSQILATLTGSPVITPENIRVI